MRYFIILILFRIINLDNINDVTIVKTSSLILIMLKQLRNFSDISTQMYIVKYVQKCIRKVYRRVKVNDHFIPMPELFA